MALKDATKREIQQLFDEILDVLDVMDPPEDQPGKAPVSVDDEALKYVNWMKDKVGLRYGEKQQDGTYVKKEYPSFGITVGGIYWGYYGTNVGDEMNKNRPLLVVRSIKKSNMCTVVPLSLQRMKDDYYFHIDLEKRDGTAIIEQLRPIDKKRLHTRVHHDGKPVEATNADLQNVFAAIKRYYADPPPWLKEKWRQAK